MWLSAPRLTQPTRAAAALRAGSSRSRRARASCPPCAVWPSSATSRVPPAHPDCAGPIRGSSTASIAARSSGVAAGPTTWRSIGAECNRVATARPTSGREGGTSRCHNPAVRMPWPLFDLTLRSARLELRSPTDDDLPALLETARAGIHDPATIPFAVAWTDARGDAFDQGFLQFFWRARASWSADAWSLPLAVFVDGRPIGVQ